MANLKEIRRRIESVISTQQITSAMKMVSVSKLRRSQNMMYGLRSYTKSFQKIAKNLLSSDGLTDNIFAKRNDSQKTLLIAIASNRGLCGAFNLNIVKKIEQLVSDELKEEYQSGNLDIYIAGKQVVTSLKYKKIIVTKIWNELSDNKDFEQIREKSDFLIKQFEGGNYKKIFVLYNHFVNAMKQEVVMEQFLPIIEEEEQSEDLKTKRSAEALPTKYLFEPSKEVVVQRLIPKMLENQFLMYVLDSSTAEHSARMTAMHQASDNASKLLKELRVSYNKARQSAITNEILEIIAGVKSLNG